MNKELIHNILYLIGILILVVMVMGYPVMLLWNWIMPIIFNLPQISFWQAVGLNLLSSILIKPTVKVTKN
jgi:hypothetical protein